jgi:hypothetical protein
LRFSSPDPVISLPLHFRAVTIHRVGPAPDSTPHRKNLGRVLVTIDDLDALIGLLRQSDPSNDLTVQFEGGYFTDPEDMRRLSDQELKKLRINVNSVQVFLDSTQAIAIGHEETCDNIYRLWARPRATKEGYSRAPERA